MADIQDDNHKKGDHIWLVNVISGLLCISVQPVTQHYQRVQIIQYKNALQ